MALLVNDYKLKITLINERARHDDKFKAAFSETNEVVREAIIPATYFIVDNFKATKNLVTCSLIGYKDDTKNLQIESRRIEFVPDLSTSQTPNFYTQAYDYAKSNISEFANAIDV